MIGDSAPPAAPLVEYIAAASYNLDDYSHGLPEQRLEEFLVAAEIQHEALGGGVSLQTNERDYEIGFEATPAQKRMVELFCQHGAEDVWEITELGEG